MSECAVLEKYKTKAERNMVDFKFKFRMVSQNGGWGLERSKNGMGPRTQHRHAPTRPETKHRGNLGRTTTQTRTHTKTVNSTQTAKLRKKLTRRSANKRKPAAAAGPKQQSTTTRGCKQKNEIDALAGLRIRWQKTRETGRKPEGGEAEDLCNSSDDENK